ncbi:MAG: hypothetical protein KAI95_05675, partial [Bacteroidales bacterium]|nr:hypothetical protein [Bacteroidales bacterium]
MTTVLGEAVMDKDELREWNNKIRLEKFDMVLPEVMRKHGVDMWIHVMRIATPDDFGAEELGSNSGVFVFTDRSGDRIERAVLGRRWGASRRGRGDEDNRLVEECDAYDIIRDPIPVIEPVGGPMTEYDYRFKGLREFIQERDPQRIAVNFRYDLGPWPTFRGLPDGISHTDYLLLTDELGEKYCGRLVSSEYVMIDYIIRKVPIEIQLIKKTRSEEVEHVMEVFENIIPGVTRKNESGLTIFRRESSGVSQRGRTRGYQNRVIRGGDILAAPYQGMFAYVLREGETGPPPEIKKLWAEYLKIDRILAENIKAGLTPREIIANYEPRFEEEGIILRDEQMHMFQSKNNFPEYTLGFDPAKTHLSIDCHLIKGRREDLSENFGPRIGSYGPDWSKDIPLPDNHHFVMEYFFYVPWPSSEHEDQYLFWWDHEQAIATENGVEYLSPPQKELY